MATYWENSCSFGLRYVSWYKYLIVSLVFSHLGFWSGNLFLIAPFPDLCLLVPFHGFRPGHGFIIIKPIKSAALQGQKLSQSALKSPERTSGNKNFLGGDPPNPPYERGNPPSRALPQLVPSALVKRLIFYGRTTFQKPTTAL